MHKVYLILANTLIHNTYFQVMFSNKKLFINPQITKKKKKKKKHQNVLTHNFKIHILCPRTKQQV